MRLENPITLPPSHEPEPDGALVRGRPEDYLDHHPGPADVLCVIEVSDSSLKSDRTTKQSIYESIYAAAGIAQFVIVNLVESRIEVYEDANVAQRCYRVVRVLHPGDAIPLRVPGGSTLGVGWRSGSRKGVEARARWAERTLSSRWSVEDHRGRNFCSGMGSSSEPCRYTMQ
jgi:Putative restriction endonuclease